MIIAPSKPKDGSQVNHHALLLYVYERSPPVAIFGCPYIHESVKIAAKSMTIETRS